MKKRERRAEDERRIWEMVVHRRGGTVGSRVRRKDLTPFASIVPHCAETNKLVITAYLLSSAGLENIHTHHICSTPSARKHDATSIA